MTRGTAAAAAAVLAAAAAASAAAVVAAVDCMCNCPTAGVAGIYKVTVKKARERKKG